MQSQELPHERPLAISVSWIRMTLCLLNFVVVFLICGRIPHVDYPYTPNKDPDQAFFEAIFSAAVFLGYALFAHLALVRRLLPMDRYSLFTPILDVFCAALLILSTNGYLSPFYLWLVFAIAAAGTTRFPFMTAIATVLGIAILGAVVTIRQVVPPDWADFAVRTGYLFAFGAFLGVLASLLSGQSRAWASLESVSTKLAQAMDMHQAVAASFEALAEIRGLEGARIVLSNGAEFVHGPESGREELWSDEWPLQSTRVELGRLEASWRRPLGRTEIALVRALCDRFATAIARIQISQSLIQSAAQDERLRVADELHDTYVQTLAAIDLHVEAMRMNLQSKPEAVEADLKKVKEIARQAAAQARKLLEPTVETEPIGPEAITNLFQSRWGGTHQCQIAKDVCLDEAQWRTVAMMVREGLNNAAKHGHATHVSFRIERKGDEAIVTLTQNGKEISGEKRFGYGLDRLLTVVSGLGGTVSLENAEAGGTTLTVKYSVAQ